jgi:hypothetical protein
MGPGLGRNDGLDDSWVAHRSSGFAYFLVVCPQGGRLLADNASMDA